MALQTIATELAQHGVENARQVFRNLPTPELYEQVIQRHEGLVAHLGPLVLRTGQHTGRAANDKFIVSDATRQAEIWWGNINRPFDPEAFERLRRRQTAYLQDKDVFVHDCYVGAARQYRVPLRVITETAWHSLFARNMFIRELDDQKLSAFQPEFTVLHTPRFHADPEVDGTNSEAFILLDFSRKLVLIGGTSYAGEIKKSAFTIMNYLLPREQVMTMHCSANYGEDRDDVAIFFGLSGTGKTTLSTSPDRTLIGDDEHGWSDDGVFNFEGGCYAKVIGVTAESEPEIYETTRRFGTILENVGLETRTRRLDLADDSLTENTRAAYPITHLPRADHDGMAGHPKNLVFLTYDAFGVLPPVARLSPDQARYHFLNGYTSKVAGTEAGVSEPRAVFSPCFGAPFMPLEPKIYANLLAQRIARHNVDCWLINTGLIGGSHGVGHRVELKHTRAIVRAILDGRLAASPTRPETRFRLAIPTACPEVPPELLDARSTWSNPEAYDRQAGELAHRFEENYRQYSEGAAEE
jgi:phosphoenolpyruvate carboxykinase (ATP)